MASFDSESVFTQDKESTSPRPVSPTDISQFIRLDQCQRFLRLQLHTRQLGDNFMREYDVTPQAIPPILTRSGARFEELIEQDVIGRFPATRFDDEERKATGTPHDNAAVIARAGALAPGEAHVLFQPRLRAKVGDWSIRGVMDILRLERDRDGLLHCLIADMKASTASRVEHRLQVAIYHEMLAAIFDQARIEHAPLELAILYRGPAEGTDAADRVDPELQKRQREDAIATFGTDHGYLERIQDNSPYLGSVQDLLTGPESTAHRVLKADFETVPFHLTYKCDGCLYNEFCMKRSAETDGLSLLPHLSDQDKSILRKYGISTVRQVAELKILVTPGDNGSYPQLIPAAGKEDLCRRLAVTWPVGQHLDELIHRAQRYLYWKKQGPPALPYIPNKGYGTLPYSGPDLHLNLVRVYIDAQHDYLNDRIYMIGARVVASNNGVEELHRQRNIVRITGGPPDSNATEEHLFIDWIAETLRAIVELAAPDAGGDHAAPIHLVFINRFAQQQLFNGLGRYLTKILGATALYDFMTQMAIYDSPIATFLDQAIQEQKNYPMVCQSLQAVAAYLKFDWNKDVPYREIFRTRMFDFWRKFDEETGEEQRVPGINGWYTSRARFNSQIPLEYAYTAWGDVSAETTLEALSDYGEATIERMLGFQARRLEAMEHIAKDFRGNRQTTLTSFVLPDLATFEQCAPTLAHALDEFVSIERFVELAAWKHQRLAPPEQRVLNGVSLIAKYIEDDQAEGIAEQNRENIYRRTLGEQFRDEHRQANPDAKRITLTKEQKEACTWDQEGILFRLKLDISDIGCSLDDALALSTLKPGSRMVLCERWTTDSRLPKAEQKPLTPTAKQLLYGQRVDLVGFDVRRDDNQRALEAHAIVSMTRGGGGNSNEFFFTGTARPLQPATAYTLETDINDYLGYWARQTVQGLIAGESNPVYNLLTHNAPKSVPWPQSSVEAQHRFLEGLDALHAAGALHDFEVSKREFISQHGDKPLLLVQGPPGTGKSYTSAFAILARIQGAMAANVPFRVFLGCKTHAATDVLLHNVQDAIAVLRELFSTHPDITERHFDRRLLDLPLYRLRSRQSPRNGITLLENDKDLAREQVEELLHHGWLVAGATPGGIYGLIKDRWSNKNLFGHYLADCLVLDEASQMSIPEAIMAALPLKEDGRIIVVGDHRQMPPIVSHDWSNETRRSFREFRSYESLFLALLALGPPKINFERSFRLHADLAEFLRKEIYHQDGINYHSKRHDVLPVFPLPDSFIQAVLAPQHPLTVVVHDEAESQHRNSYEQELIAPILRVLADEQRYNLSPEEGLGVVVPHRAQRAALQEGVPELIRIDPETSAVTVSAVDTVERFQGDERTVILIGSTESDREYLLATGNFLLDPRRLTVALSRAKKKLVLVASRSVFEIFSADEEMFRNAQIWKNLLRGTCTERLWEGNRHGHHVEVWGNVPSEPQASP